MVLCGCVKGGYGCHNLTGMNTTLSDVREPYPCNPVYYLATQRLTGHVLAGIPCVARRADAAVVGSIAATSIVAEYP